MYDGILGTHGRDVCAAAGRVTLQVVTSAKCQSTLWTKPLVSKHRELFLAPQTLLSVAQLHCSDQFVFPWNLDVFISDTVIQSKWKHVQLLIRHLIYHHFLLGILITTDACEIHCQKATCCPCNKMKKIKVAPVSRCVAYCEGGLTARV